MRCARVCVCESVLARVANRSSFQTTTTAAAAVAAADVHDLSTREPRAARGQTFITIPNRPHKSLKGPGSNRSHDAVG